MGLDDVALDGLFGGGGAWGLGLALVAAVGLLAWKGGRPILKKAIATGLMLSERAQEVAAEATEQMQDIYAEARAEFDQRATA